MSANLDHERALAHLHLMWRIRAFEEEAIAGQKDGVVLGAIHPSVGQEAVAAMIMFPNFLQTPLSLLSLI